MNWRGEIRSYPGGRKRPRAGAPRVKALYVKAARDEAMNARRTSDGSDDDFLVSSSSWSDGDAERLVVDNGRRMSLRVVGEVLVAGDARVREEGTKAEVV
eukprot:CAMPEP_0201599600 /NCGR_PEP_ID=MMETSP0492-20130828/986_1 /ASSEMBLY_ACC=CAM_ASM_000837 /TAXON_ID=420259 /ORGANISM="Thalassiosira gravida, Strain GMp14c1" /LENGTH=99 /DNA_ID=CAMNT_0048062201 /DNA_START=1046 /DNA_END=1345 /DNA_ORIENTATION=+